MQHELKGLMAYIGKQNWFSLENYLMSFICILMASSMHLTHIKRTCTRIYSYILPFTDCRVKGLHTPLMAVIHHHGYAVIAESILPINQNTLLYGSSDGGYA